MDTTRKEMISGAGRYLVLAANSAAVIGPLWYYATHRWLSEDATIIAWSFLLLGALNLYNQIAGAPTLISMVIKRRRLEEERKIRELEGGGR